MDIPEHRILISGSGGQGVLFFGRLLAVSCMNDGKEVTWFPSYGAEMRGGTANCTVIISSEMIGSPVIRNPGVLVAFNELSHAKFASCLRPGGLLLYDSSLFSTGRQRQDINTYAVPALAVAAVCATPAQANMVMMGALLSLTGIARLDSVLRGLAGLVGERCNETRRLNETAIKKGFEVLNDSKSTRH